MSRGTYVLYTLLLALLLVLSQTHGSPKPMNLWEFIDWVSGRSE